MDVLDMITGEPDYLLDVYKAQIKDVIKVLKSICFRENCYLLFRRNGLRVVVDDQLECQANVYFKAESFDEYTINADRIVLYVKAQVLLNALVMFHDKIVGARFMYRSDGEPLEVFVETSNMKGRVYVPTFNPPDILNLKCNLEDVKVKLLFEPLFIKNIFKDLDTACQNARFEFYSDRFIIETKADIYQLTEIRRCNDNKDQMSFVTAIPNNRGCLVSYKIDCLRRLIPIFNISKKVKFQIDSTGVLSVHMLVEHSEDNLTFIEFTCNRKVLGAYNVDDDDESGESLSHMEEPQLEHSPELVNTSRAASRLLESLL